MKKSGKILSFSNQKGGAGKTTLSIMFSNFVHNCTNLNLLYIDADDMQKSFEAIRESDKEYYDISEDETYDYATINAKDLPVLFEDLQDEYDLIVLDLAGSMTHAGNLEVYPFIDHFFIPLVPNSQQDISSSFSFVDEVQNTIVPFRKSKGLETSVNIFLNRVSTGLLSYKQVKETIPTWKQQGYSFINSEIGDYKAVLGDQLNTINRLYPKSSNKNTKQQFDTFCKEVLSVIDFNFTDVQKEETVWKELATE